MNQLHESSLGARDLIIYIISTKRHVNIRLYAQLQAEISFRVMMYVLTYRCPQQSRENGTKGRKVVGEFTTNETTGHWNTVEDCCGDRIHWK